MHECCYEKRENHPQPQGNQNLKGIGCLQYKKQSKCHDDLHEADHHNEIKYIVATIHCITT